MRWASRISVLAIPCWYFWCFDRCQALVNRAGSPWIGYDYHTYPHPAKKSIVPRDIMVDVINSLGLNLLAIHNENNENNIAISPYGALSVLIALGEGLQGDAVREIQHFGHLPNDISIIRIGLRDIHRHLKSYFIPREGFLAGLTLNHENVTLRPEYEEILKFYGYDATAFNYALYPEPQTTEKPTPTTTEKTSPMSTTLSPTTEEVTSKRVTSEDVTTVGGDAREVTTTKKPIPTTITEKTSPMTTSHSLTTEEVTSKRFTSEDVTIAEEDARELDTVTERDVPIKPPTLASEPSSTTEKTYTSSIESMSTTLESITATQNTPTTTILPSSTTDGSETMATSTEKPVTTIEPVISTLESITTTLKSVIVAVEPATPSEEPAINIIETTTTLEPVTTALESKPTTVPTTTPEETVSTTLESVQVEKEPETTTQELATTTLVAKTTMLEPVSTTEPVPEITTTSESVTITTPKPVITTPEPEVTTTEAVVITTEPIATTEPVTMTTDTVTTALEPVTMMTTLPESINNEVGAEPLATDGATTSLSVNEPVTVIETTTIETESGRPTETESSTETVTSTSETTISSTAPTTGETPTDVAPFTSAISVKSTEVFQENSIDNEITTNDGKTGGNGFAGAPKRIARSQFNVIELNRLHTKPLGPPKRRARSVVDYVIARYYEDQQLPTLFHVPFMGEEEPSFLINGNYREYRINFMKYDSVLPFTYVSYLDAMALSFPLDSDKYYLLLILPRSDTGIDKLICDLRLNGSLRHIVNNLMYRHVVATIPSFMLKGYVTLTPTFQKLGIKKVFEPRQADFSPMTDNGGIYVTNIEQAITVNIRNYVDPNSLENHRRIQQYDPVEFKADHPFLYFVMDSELNVALMAGKVVNPLNSRIS